MVAIAFFTADTVSAAETPKAPPSAKPTEVKAAPAKPQPISLADYFAGVSKPGISADEQAAFVKKHAGASVTWAGYVRSINKNMSPDGAYYQLVLKAKLAEEKGVPLELFVAQLADAKEKEVLALQKDQKVTVSGTLKVGKNAALPTVAGAKLSGS